MDEETRAEIKIVKHEIQALKEFTDRCYKEIRLTISTNSVQDQDLISTDSRLKNLEEFVKEHRVWHEKQTDTRANRNWQLWVLLITIGLSSIATLIFNVLK